MLISLHNLVFGRKLRFHFHLLRSPLGAKPKNIVSIFISVKRDHYVEAIWICFVACMTPDLCLERILLIGTAMHVTICLSVCMCASTHSWRRREDRSVRPLGNYGAAAGILH